MEENIFFPVPWTNKPISFFIIPTYKPSFLSLHRFFSLSCFIADSPFSASPNPGRICNPFGSFRHSGDGAEKLLFPSRTGFAKPDGICNPVRIIPALR